MQFTFTPTVADISVAVRAGLARTTGSNYSGGDGLGLIRRLGTGMMIVGFLLLLAGTVVLLKLIPQLAGAPNRVHIILMAAGCTLIGVGWTARRLRFDMEKILSEAMESPDVAGDPGTLAAVKDLGQLQIDITRRGVGMRSDRESAHYDWSEIIAIDLIGEHFLIQGKGGMKGAMVVLPVRVLPEGTNLQAFAAALEQLRQGIAVPGFDAP